MRIDARKFYALLAEAVAGPTELAGRMKYSEERLRYHLHKIGRGESIASKHIGAFAAGLGKLLRRKVELGEFVFAGDLPRKRREGK